MDEARLRVLLDRATANEPPIGPLARNSLRAGLRLRRRRQLTGAATAAAAVAVLAIGVPVLTGTSAGPAHRGYRPAPPAVYVATSAQTVVPINLATNTAGRPITAIDSSLGGLAISPNGRTVYELGGRNMVIPIDTATKKAGRRSGYPEFR